MSDNAWLNAKDQEKIINYIDKEFRAVGFISDSFFKNNELNLSGTSTYNNKRVGPMWCGESNEEKLVGIIKESCKEIRKSLEISPESSNSYDEDAQAIIYWDLAPFDAEFYSQPVIGMDAGWWKSENGVMYFTKACEITNWKKSNSNGIRLIAKKATPKTPKETEQTHPKQTRYSTNESDYLDDFFRTSTPEQVRGAMMFTIGKYQSRLGKKDSVLSEVTKIADYSNRWMEYERKLEEMIK